MAFGYCWDKNESLEEKGSITISGYSGTVSELYAEANGFPFHSIGASQKPLVFTGTCGTNATWKMDVQTSTLTISGTGATEPLCAPGVNEDESRREYWSTARTVVVEQGITHLIAYSGLFANFTKLESIVLPEGLVEIDDDTFRNCPNLKRLSVPQSVTSIGTHAFGYLFDEDKNSYTLDKDVSLSVYENSAGMQYAKDNNIPYTVLS